MIVDDDASWKTATPVKAADICFKTFHCDQESFPAAWIARVTAAAAAAKTSLQIVAYDDEVWCQVCCSLSCGAALSDLCAAEK